MNRQELTATVLIIFGVITGIVAISIALINATRAGDREYNRIVSEKVAACATISEPTIRALCLEEVL